MSILKNKKEGLTELIILGPLVERAEKDELIGVLLNSRENITLLSFIDATMLADEILEQLNMLGYLNSSTVRLNVFNGYLYSYLIKLGIRNTYYMKSSTGNVKNRLEGIEPTASYYLGDSESDRVKLYEFLDKINDAYGYDYTQYRIESIKRRIKIGMMKSGITIFDKYAEEVINNEDVFMDLFLEFSINVTDFFRDSKTFYLIRDKVIPFLESFTHLKIWCAGCSTGEEAYSLAIMLEELGVLEKSFIYATDFNGYIIEEAKNGLFSEERVLSGEKNYITSGGTKAFKDYFDYTAGYYRINRRFRKKILFFTHSLLTSGILNEFNLILCRNVLIYFEQSLQEKTLKLFKDSLDLSGFLVLGRSEGLLFEGADKLFEIHEKENRIYKNTI